MHKECFKCDHLHWLGHHIFEPHPAILAHSHFKVLRMYKTNVKIIKIHSTTFTQTQEINSFIASSSQTCINVFLIRKPITRTRKEKLHLAWLAQFISNGKAQVILFSSSLWKKFLTLLIYLIELASKIITSYKSPQFSDFNIQRNCADIFEMNYLQNGMPLKQETIVTSWMKELPNTNQQARRDLYLI